MPTGRYTRQGKLDSGQKRNLRFTSRISQDELNLIDDLQLKRNKYGGRFYSRIDVIMLAVKFATGQLTINELTENRTPNESTTNQNPT